MSVRKRILLVDDSKTVLFMERLILKQEPVDVLTAADGEQAVEVARRERPDLVLMDVVMPGIDGIEALRRLRELPETREIPVIMVTTRGEGPSVEDAFASGCTSYLTKPVNALELITRVRECLGAADATTVDGPAAPREEVAR